MVPSEEVCVDLMRQLKLASQLQHAWIMQLWQQEQGPHPAAAMLLSEIERRGESRLSELAKHRMVDISVISRQVSQLAEAGLIERRPAPEDGRASLVKVSEEGERRLVRWKRLHAEFLSEAFGEWDEAELKELTERLGAVNADLRAVVDQETPCPARSSTDGR
ncbi:DNA-binding transcriptional regulator, MarR family [Prauserella marina]|uniref:DNA-binding transcriptional regulator, MarR family n=2 Tax=Prauserella marina TaxID=530584 RepID=A0A1G6SKS4_9PSEU|nr:DNA-binding MarR family transcriptional regulator [Prauserella marina]SDD17393.1 DNA-binding transcriptional regulator, MarR family [Prauserella marina]